MRWDGRWFFVDIYCSLLYEADSIIAKWLKFSLGLISNIYLFVKVVRYYDSDIYNR